MNLLQTIVPLRISVLKGCTALHAAVAAQMPRAAWVTDHRASAGAVVKNKRSASAPSLQFWHACRTTSRQCRCLQRNVLLPYGGSTFALKPKYPPCSVLSHMSPAQGAACIMLRPTHQRKAFDNSRTRRLPRQNGPSRHSQYFQRSMPLLGASPCALNAAPNVASKIAPKCKATTARHFK